MTRRVGPDARAVACFALRRPASPWCLSPRRVPLTWLALPVVLMAAVTALASNGDALSESCDAGRPRESVTVAYSEGGNAQRVVFTPSDDGTLRAVDAADGRLLWTYR